MNRTTDIYYVCGPGRSGKTQKLVSLCNQSNGIPRIWIATEQTVRHVIMSQHPDYEVITLEDSVYFLDLTMCPGDMEAYRRFLIRKQIQRVFIEGVNWQEELLAVCNEYCPTVYIEIRAGREGTHAPASAIQQLTRIFTTAAIHVITVSSPAVDVKHGNFTE